jgi:hypothetical protein
LEGNPVEEVLLFEVARWREEEELVRWTNPGFSVDDFRCWRARLEVVEEDWEEESW